MKDKRIWIVLAILAVLAVGMFFLYRHFSPKAQAGEKQISLHIDYGDGTVKDFALTTQAEFLRGALEEVALLEGEESTEYGYTLYAIDGVTADFTKDSAYWAIYVGEEYGIYNLADQPITDGEHYTIKYETY